MYTDVSAPGRNLHQRFIALGDMTGKTADEVIAAVRCQPISISSMADGGTLLQWQATGCHMALLFDRHGDFVKITHEYANFESNSEPQFDPMITGVIAAVGIVAIICLFVVLHYMN
jgi:hypothetical protein